MELMPGYKRCDVGLVPENWAVESLGDLAHFFTSGSRGWAQFYSDYGALFIRSQNVRDGLLRFDDIQYVCPPSGAEGDRTKVELNDLLITITGNSVGNVALVDQVFDEAYISQHVGLVRLKDSTKAEYICRYLSPNSPGNFQIAGSQSGQSKPGLNLQNLKDFVIALPPSSEELHAITSALSDMDALLATLDQVIAKKRDLKQAVMQQLLTGKARLPGFSGEWVEKKLGEVADVIDPHPSHRAPSEVSNGIPFVGIGDLDEEGNIVGAKLRLVDASVLQEHAQRYNLSDGLIGLGRVASIGKVVALKKQADRYAISPTLGVIYGRQVPRGFLLYSLKSQFVTEQFTKIMSGSTRSSVGMEVLRELKIAIPPSKEEQSAIADVLSSMDAELTALDARRDKTRNIKQAMMQELLTGKTRLV